ncbi:uncharacterized protein LOC129958501 [Argiope bruennichi]|uniref:Uncharacterized protein n=1 Tax=Argiope bruennichi TaxID=94029 RepID=A0A8T0F1N2_ARGBR|nr:uncharacterized protein LOC129958501 [Argiope bruennichi]KAF8784382.1 hypothetical protein HNY73_010066 [Argiope bruennichi]
MHKNFLVYTSGCRIPKYDPFDFTVRRYYIKTPYTYNCGPKKPIFHIQKEGVVTVDEEELYRQHKIRMDQMDCYFNPIIRKNRGRKPDDNFYLGREHDMIFNLPIEDDFILLKCKNENKTFIETPLLLTPIKTKVEVRSENNLKKNFNLKEKLNVIIVGIDSISKLNFVRYFQNTLKYLRTDVSAIELHGFVKVADNTYPNLIPFLTGRHRNHFKAKERRYGFFDDVDFIWKRYAAVGYRTLFSEDAPNMGAFVLNRRGFKNPPTDYYSRPYSVAVEALNTRHKTHCIGSKLEMEVYFDYLRNFVSTMENRLYFTFTFVARLTHDIFKYAGFADKPAFELVSYLKENEILNRSLFIFFSDHGIRFGDIRRTYIGKIEERMPFMFLIFPEWFLKKYPEFAKNLEINRNRLTTPYDIHATLLHLLDLERETFYTLHGQSLLTEISSERTCADAMIAKHWCTCQTHQIVPSDDGNVRQAALAVVRKLNRLLKPYFRLCAPLKLSKVLDARLVQPNELLVEVLPKDYLITLLVIPSGAIFEATVQGKKKQFTVSDEVSRINKYGNESDCIHDPAITKYCYCKANLIKN